MVTASQIFDVPLAEDELSVLGAHGEMAPLLVSGGALGHLTSGA